MIKAGSVIKKVEQEYGEPFWDVVAAYAADGNSLTTTAKILGYTNASTLWYLINRHKKEISFPKLGQCNAMQNPGPMRESSRILISKGRIESDFSAGGQYERRTGEPAIDAIRRMAPTHTITEVARFLGWNNVTPMRAWMKLRGYEVTFKAAKLTPPRRKPWCDIDLRGAKKRA
jgi:hypothetical protein